MRFRPALRLLALLISCTALATAAEVVHVRGEDTMVLAAQRCSALFKVDNPRTPIAFDIAGGGAANGLTALENGDADLVQAKNAQGGANLDRKGRRIVRIPVTIESIVVYVNQSNSVRELSLADLKGIFTGEITNWSQLGGSNHRITLYSGESTGGINDYFQQAVLGGAEADNFWGKASTKELVEAVARDKDGIGYSTFYPMASGVHLVAIRKAKGSPAIEPTSDNIRKHSYPLTRTVFWYVAEHPTGALREFLSWIYMPHGQLVFESVGFFPLMPDDRSAGLSILDGKPPATAR
jgi:phosphate transport system substrate-binding protein